MTFVQLPEPIWLAVHTMAGHEATAARHLVRQGYWTWYPFERYREPSKRAKGVSREVERPYFSRYIFVALRYAHEAIGPINETVGVSRVVCKRLSGEPLTIPCRVWMLKVGRRWEDEALFPERDDDFPF